MQLDNWGKSSFLPFILMSGYFTKLKALLLKIFFDNYISSVYSGYFFQKLSWKQFLKIQVSGSNLKRKIPLTVSEIWTLCFSSYKDRVGSVGWVGAHLRKKSEFLVTFIMWFVTVICYGNVVCNSNCQILAL